MAKINKYEIILDEWHATELARMAEFDGFDDDLKYLTDVINSIIDIKKFDRPDYGDMHEAELPLYNRISAMSPEERKKLRDWLNVSKDVCEAVFISLQEGGGNEL